MATDHGQPSSKKTPTVFCGPGFRNFLKLCSSFGNESMHEADAEDLAWYRKLVRKHFSGLSPITVEMLIGLFLTSGFKRGDIKPVLDAVVVCLKRNGLDKTYQMPKDVVEQMLEHIAHRPRFPSIDSDSPRRKPLNQITCDEGLVPFLELCAQYRHLVVTGQDGDKVNSDWFGSLLLRHFKGNAAVTVEELLALFTQKGFNLRQVDLVLFLLLERLKRAGLDESYELPDRAGELLLDHLNPSPDLEAAS